MRGAEAGLDAFDFEKRAKEFLQRPFQVRHRDVFVDRQTFDLMEHRRVGLVIVGTVDATGADDAQGRAFGLHRADLHGAGVGAQHVGRTVVALGTGHIERVHLGTCGVVAGDVQRVEVIPIGVDARTFGDRKPQLGEDRGHFLGHLADGVDRALTRRARGQCHVQPFAAQTFIKGRIPKCCFLRGNGGVDLVLERVQRGADCLAFFGRHTAQLAHLQGDFALFTHGGQTDVLQRGFVGGTSDLAQIFRFQVVHIGLMSFARAGASRIGPEYKRQGHLKRVL